MPRAHTRLTATVLAMLLVSGATSLSAQSRLPAALVARSTDVKNADDSDASIAHSRTHMLQSSGAPRATASPWWAPLASAFLPGSGQFALGQQRSVAYLVAEGYLLVQALSARRDHNADRDEYRAIAADVARGEFGGTKPIGPWRYYESMEETRASGAFDLIAGGDVDPETDETTYNGARWRLARENHWQNPNVAPAANSPEYQRALAEYVRDAVRDEYRWNWNEGLQQDVYRQTIASANRSSQRATNFFGLMMANHLASTIDAYVSVRVRRFGGVRAVGLAFDGLETTIRPVGDPASGKRQVVSAIRFTPVGKSGQTSRTH